MLDAFKDLSYEKSEISNEEELTKRIKNKIRGF
jgi:hypothetical protein